MSKCKIPSGYYEKKVYRYLWPVGAGLIFLSFVFVFLFAGSLIENSKNNFPSIPVFSQIIFLIGLFLVVVAILISFFAGCHFWYEVRYSHTELRKIEDDDE